MKRLIMTGIACMLFASMPAQNWRRQIKESKEKALKEYEAFRIGAEQDYSDFRRRANEEYARFMANPWTPIEMQSEEEIPWSPKPPQPFVADPDSRPVIEPIPFNGKPLPPGPIDQPEPIEPMLPRIDSVAPVTVLRFFGTNVPFHFGATPTIQLQDVSEASVVKLWNQLATPSYDNLIAECLKNRTDLNLCDWGYVMLTQQVAEHLCGGHTDEAVVLHMYLLTQSGYQMRICRAGDHLGVLVGSQEKIYHYKFFMLNNIRYYLFDRSLENKPFYAYEQAFPEEKLMSLVMTQPNLAMNATAPRTLASKGFPMVTATVTMNKNLIDFYDHCPISAEWTLYSKASLSKAGKESLYPILSKAIEGKSQAQAANILINFVQTAFAYATDQDQFGYERPLYPDESLYYPYCDCEDRSILFACLVRELLKLDVVLLDYPEHLATAVRFTEEVQGDYLMVNDKRYLVCDPTYINASIGMCMEQFKTTEPIVILF